MALYHSSDWHLSFLEDGTIQKPMDQRSWSTGTNHYKHYLSELVEEGRMLRPEDVLCITGDITHEVGMQKILPNLMWIWDHFCCQIVLIRGNHDQKLRRDRMKDLLQSSGLWNRMHFVWEGETVGVGGYEFYCGSNHHEEGFVLPVAGSWVYSAADVLLCHYPLPAESASLVASRFPKAKAYLSGHIHCTSNTVEGGIKPDWYEEKAAPTDGKTFGNCTFYTGTTDVRDWKGGQLIRKILP